MNSKHFARLGLATALALVMAPSAFAAGTDAGTNITNTATVNYDVGGVSQPPVTNPTPDDFEVDRRILFTVAATDGAESVAPGAQNQALTYVIQNDTNDTVDFYLSVEELTGDDFDGADGGSAAQFYLDDGDGIFNGADTLLPVSPLGKPYLDNVPEYNGVPGNLRVVHVVYDIDTGLANGDTADVYLVADATSNAGADSAIYTESATDGVLVVDTVLGDADGPATNDDARDATHSAMDSYLISTATLAVSKTSRVVTDPFNCTVVGDSTSCTGTPKRIPGAVIQYCITVQNNGGAIAEDVVITDQVPSATTYVASSIWTNVSGATTVCDLTDTLTAAGNMQPEDDNTVDADALPETDPAGGSFDAGTETVSVQLKPDVAGSGGIARAAFRVTID